MPTALRFCLSLLLAGMISWASAARADAEADYNLGFQRWEEGDMVGAMTALRKSSGQGNLKAMVLLAEILDISEFDDEAIAMYRKAADLGEPGGMFGLGAMTAAGEGVAKKDMVEGRRWIQKAAELGHVQAIIVMAQAYLKGELDLTAADRDTPEALRWVKLAAKNEFLPAVDALAEAYRTGKMLTAAVDPALANEYVAQGNKLRGIDPSKKKKGRKSAVAQAAPAESRP